MPTEATPTPAINHIIKYDVPPRECACGGTIVCEWFSGFCFVYCNECGEPKSDDGAIPEGNSP